MTGEDSIRPGRAAANAGLREIAAAPFGRLARTALFLAMALVASPGARAADAAPGGDAAQVDQGRRIYAQHCSHCHGFNMVSAGNVTFDLREFPRDQKDRFLESVVNGKDNRMPPWGDVLSVDEIEAIWAYVLTRGKK
jgi:cytochrome c55X